MEYLDNKALLNAHKTAFLCSRQVGSRAVLRCYDWATNICKEEGVVVSGFQSKIERDVLHFLLRGNKPIIYCACPKDVFQPSHRVARSNGGQSPTYHQHST